MHRFTAALLLTLFGTSAAYADCSPQREHQLLSATIYREAEMARPLHASIMSVVLVRLKSGKFGRTICSVLTWKPKQFEHTLPPKVSPEKLRMAQQSARIFLNEYHSQGYVSTEAHVFQMLGNRDSFVASFARSRHKRHYLTFGDNSFYKSGS